MTPKTLELIALILATLAGGLTIGWLLASIVKGGGM